MIISDVKCRNTLRCKGCGIIKSKTTHGYSKTALHMVWLGIKGRCTNINNTSYKYYGEKGVSICEEWSGNFLSFRSWCISQGHVDGMHISRFGDVGNYSPSNCKVTTKRENIGERNTIYAKRNKRIKNEASQQEH